MRRFREIAAADVGHYLFEAFGRKWRVSDFIGRIFPGDVGKRVYQVGGILQVENNEQRAERLAKTEGLKAMEPGVDCDTMFMFVTLANQSYATEAFFGRRKEAEKRLDQKAIAGGDVLTIYLYGPSGLVNSVTL